MKVNVNSRDLDKFCIKHEVGVEYNAADNSYILRKNGAEIEIVLEQDGLIVLDMNRPNFIAETLKISVYDA